MSLHSLDARFRSSPMWRALGIALCCWIASVIALAGLAAYDDGLELYRFTALVLLLVGVPTMLATVIYAGSLLSTRTRKWSLVALTISGLTVAAMVIYDAYEDGARKERTRQEALERSRPSPERRAECARECGGNQNEYCQIVCEMHKP